MFAIYFLWDSLVREAFFLMLEEETMAEDSDQNTSAIVFQFTGPAKDQLDSLSERLEVSSRAETLHRCIRLMLWYLDKREEGYKIALVDPDNALKVIVLDVLS